MSVILLRARSGLCHCKRKSRDDGRMQSFLELIVAQLRSQPSSRARGLSDERSKLSTAATAFQSASFSAVSTFSLGNPIPSNCCCWRCRRDCRSRICGKRESGGTGGCPGVHSRFPAKVISSQDFDFGLLFGLDTGFNFGDHMRKSFWRDGKYASLWSHAKVNHSLAREKNWVFRSQ